MNYTFKSKFHLGQRVNHLTEANRTPGIVVGVTFFPGGTTYTVQWSSHESRTHYELELTEAP